MRKPETIEVAYIDFDGFFAGVEEQARPALRGKPIGVTPQDPSVASCIIAANALAKKKGAKSLMSIREARKIVPDIVFIEQSPDLYERAHRKLLFEIESQVPVDAVCSIDELCCKLDPNDIADPEGLIRRIKERLREEIGPYLTCSIGIGPNRQLAKIASDMNKPNGHTILHPHELPGLLLDLNIDDIPGVGRKMRTKLNMAGINDVQGLWDSEPKHLRRVWGNVSGERFWYALHGYQIQADPTKRSMFGHGRVLPPEFRYLHMAYECACVLTTKAARRLRRAKLIAYKFSLWLSMKDDSWGADYDLGGINDDQMGLYALTMLWRQAEQDIPKSIQNSRMLMRVHVAFHELQDEGSKQFDIFNQDEPEREKWTKLSTTLDGLNRKYAKRLVTMGTAKAPGKYAGGKISYSRVPDMEDFW